MYNRRSFLKNMGNILAMAALPLGSAVAGNNRIIVVGGGVAGTRVAAYLKISLPLVNIILFDSALKNVSKNNYSAIQTNYKPISKEVLDEMGVHVIADRVMQMDPADKSVRVANGKNYKADFLVVASGVDFKWNDIEGYVPGNEQGVIHAWRHPSNENELWKKIESMEDGDKVVISVPEAPYCFPEGPYKRATRIADYLKTFKAKSKLLVLDGNNTFPRMHSYQEIWRSKFPHNMLEWVSASNGGGQGSVNIQNNTLNIAGEIIKADVLNFIPAQQAGLIARQAGLCVDSDWCKVKSQTLESVYFENVFVIGDANDIHMNNKTSFSADKDALRCVTGIKKLLS